MTSWFKYQLRATLLLNRNNYHLLHFTEFGFSGGSEVKASACNAGDVGSIPGSGRSPGEGNGNPLQYSCLENPMDGGAWWARVHGVAQSRTRLSNFTFTFIWYSRRDKAKTQMYWYLIQKLYQFILNMGWAKKRWLGWSECPSFSFCIASDLYDFSEPLFPRQYQEDVINFKILFKY